MRSTASRTTTAATSRGGPTDPSHDADLRRGVLRTDVSRPVAGLLVGIFLTAIATVPIAQVITDKRNDEQSVLPDLFARWPTQETIKQFEEDLEKASAPREWVRPRLQLAFTRVGGFGNTKVVVGRDGWLFYQPGVAAVGGPGLLNDAILSSRAKAAGDAGDAALFPDPRPAILDFRAYLASRGIALVLFPVPDKAALQPAELRGPRAHDSDGAVGMNPDHARLSRELAAAGVRVFDATPARLDHGAPPRFLRQDTHWTPAWMEEVAGDLARVVRESAPAGLTAAPRVWTTTTKSVSRVGDLVDMLGLPTGQSLFQPQEVSIHEVRKPDGALFEPEAAGEVLLLGDSFSNVFTLGQMGWGEAAGLAPHLARALGCAVDVIAQNDAGAHATRQLLWNELTAGAAAAEGDQGQGGPAGGDAAEGARPRAGDRLSGKKVVVWEFASRELAVGNWKPLIWPRRGGDAPAEGRLPAP
ncbi:MAG: hypothetical protein ABUS79_06155 [Pseudomonadota bacterium]